jgi:hypothetical protein
LNVGKKQIMKFKNIILVIILSLFLNTLNAQEQAKIPAGISIALKAGNASELSKYFNSTIELQLIDKEDFYKKAMAEAVLKDFFASHPTRDFSIKHQGAKSDAQYAIGTLKTDRGDFRVYFLLKKAENELLIYLMRIEVENGK